MTSVPFAQAPLNCAFASFVAWMRSMYHNPVQSKLPMGDVYPLTVAAFFSQEPLTPPPQDSPLTPPTQVPTSPTSQPPPAAPTANMPPGKHAKVPTSKSSAAKLMKVVPKSKRRQPSVPKAKPATPSAKEKKKAAKAQARAASSAQALSTRTSSGAFLLTVFPHNSPLETLVPEIALTLLSHLVPSAKANLCVCSKRLWNAYGPKINPTSLEEPRPIPRPIPNIADFAVKSLGEFIVVTINTAGGLFKTAHTKNGPVSYPTPKLSTMLEDVRLTLKADFLCVQETGCLANNSFKSLNYVGSTSSSSERGTGIFCLNDKFTLIQEYPSAMEGCHTGALYQVHNTQVAIHTVYVPHEANDRAVLMRELKKSIPKHRNLILTGDFNFIEHVDDATPRAKEVDAPKAHWPKIVERLNLKDVTLLCSNGPDRSQPTRVPPISNQIARRIDRTLWSEGGDVLPTQHGIYWVCRSDHRGDCVKFLTKLHTKFIPDFRLRMEIFTDNKAEAKKLQAFAAQTALDLKSGPGLTFANRHENFKKKIFEYLKNRQNALKDELSEERTALKDAEVTLRKKLRDAYNNSSGPEAIAHIQRHLLETSDELAKTIEALVQLKRDNVRMRWRNSEDRNNKAWNRQANRAAPRAKIQSMLDPATQQYSQDPKRMAEIIRDSYEKIYEHKTTNANILREINDLIRSKLSNEVKASIANIDATFSEKDVRDAVRLHKNDTASGPDKLPYSVWRTIGEAYNSDLTKVFNEIGSRSRLPDSMTETIIVPIPKKGTPANTPGNIRPISLLNCDYKLFTYILARKIMETVQKLIPPRQKGFIQGRNIHEHILHVQMLVSRLENDPTASAALLFLDWEKAFDRISHQAIWESFEQMGFSHSFLQCLKAIYRKNTARVLVNGKLSSEFQTHSGTKQGCPISPLIFVIMAELFNVPLEDALTGVGGPKQNLVVKTLGYADDTVVGIADLRDLDTLATNIERYEQATAAKLNFRKSQALVIGNDQALRDGLERMQMPIIAPGQPITYLGCPIFLSTHDDTSPDINVSASPQMAVFENKMLEALERACWRWNGLHPSLFGKALLANTQVLSILWYYAAVLPISDQSLLQARRQTTKWIWNYKKFPDLRWQNLFAPSNEAGLGILNPTHQAHALQAKWALHLSNPDYVAGWKYEALEQLEEATRSDDVPFDVLDPKHVPYLKGVVKCKILYSILRSWSLVSYNLPPLQAGDWVRSIGHGTQLNNWIYRVKSTPSWDGPNPHLVKCEYWDNDDFSLPPKPFDELWSALVRIKVVIGNDNIIEQDGNPHSWISRTIVDSAKPDKPFTFPTGPKIPKPNRRLFKCINSRDKTASKTKPGNRPKKALAKTMKVIRNSMLPGRAKTLLFKCAHHAVHTGERALTIGIPNATHHCMNPGCNAPIESLEHMLLECPMVSPVIQVLKDTFPSLNNLLTDPNVSLLLGTNTTDRISLEILGSALYSVWKCRNEVRLQGIQHCQQSTLERAIHCISKQFTYLNLANVAGISNINISAWAGQWKSFLVQHQAQSAHVAATQTPGRGGQPAATC